jgi:alanyl-tRNA synthetase
MKRASQIRREFLDYFATRHGHAIVPSSPVVPQDDPTLLFTNAGMNQFKDVFLGTGTRPYPRAVDTQKCIRAGGKHNDLEDVGKDTYHHTFFEMLGNWSFGDYFKAEAIEWAWELLTKVWKLDPARLHATYFEGNKEQGLDADDDAKSLWSRFLPKERIHPGGLKDNFWEMGETGPCGPCSEIHYDFTEDKSGGKLVNANDPRVMEIWNLVFIQFNRNADRSLTPLPAKHVDTGMGFERIARVLQNKNSNYDTDLWLPIFLAIENHTGAHPYTGHLDDPVDIAYRVIADHSRCLTVAIADGAMPSNEGRGYVLRRILRRAVRHAHQTLGVRGPLLYQVVPSVIESLGEAFPELREHQERVASTVRAEEEMFLKTLDRGLELFEQAVERARQVRMDEFTEKEVQQYLKKKPSGAATMFRAADIDWLRVPVSRRPIIGAEDAFKLHDTFGFPIDLTRVMAEERGLTVDEKGFDDLMEKARARSRPKVVDEDLVRTLPPHAIARLRHLNVPPTDDIDKYHVRPVTAEVAAIWNGSDFDNAARQGRRYAVVLDRTNFYAEQGGQIGDQGFIHTPPTGGQVGGWGFEHKLGKAAVRFEVEDAQRVGDFILHIGHIVEGTLRVGDKVMADVSDARRNPTKANHTVTHLLNHALRQVLDEPVEQRGSLVAPDRLRFDFTSSRALSPAEVNAVERLVNAAIHQDLPVHALDAPLADALKIVGVRAVFGEKYPDPVRVVSIGPSVDRLLANPQMPRWTECAIEFCGGTHLESTGEARRMVILSEQALSAGIRRITAITGPAALAAEAAGRELAARLYRAISLQGDELVEEVNDISRQIEGLTIGMLTHQRLAEELDKLRGRVREHVKKAQEEQRAGVVDQARVLAENIKGRIIVDRLLGADADGLLAAVDVLRSRRPEVAGMLFSGDEIESKVNIIAVVPRELIAKGLKAGDWVRTVAPIVGGGGGGRPDLAQAGGKDPERIEEAIEKARSYAESLLG